MSKKEAVKNKELFKYVKKTFPYFKKYLRHVMIFILTFFFASLASAFIPAITGYAVDELTKSDFNKTIFFIFLILVVEFIVAIIKKIGMISYIKMQKGVTNDLRIDVSTSMLELQMRDLNNKSSGVFIDRINKDPEQIINTFDEVRYNLTALITTIGVIFYIFYLSWIIGFILVLMQIVVYYVERTATNIWVKRTKVKLKKNEKTMGIVSECIKGIRDIKLLGIKNPFKTKISNNLEEVYNYELNMVTKDTNFVLLRDVIITISSFVILFLGIYLVKFDSLKVSSLIVIFMYRTRIFDFVLNFAWSERSLKEFCVSAGRIFEIIDGVKFKKEKFGNINLKKIQGYIEFKKVGFEYDKKEGKVLKDISFKINPNDTVAIVGKSGSGKSTVFNLLTKAFNKTKGNIYLDQVEINDLTEESLRNNITIISQSPYIFNMSIKQNLLLVKPNASDKQLENVCKVAELHDYIISLPKKYNSLLGEGGVNLSGGQKQRLAIARALLKDSEIILFDEATSALDNETQKNIQNAINNISKYYTILIIAHRLTTIKDCNKIIVIDKGKIVGIGTHSELLEKNKIYKTLYQNELESVN